MDVYSEIKTDYNGNFYKEWNCCHPSGYAGRVLECFHANGLLRFRSFCFGGSLHRALSEGPAFEDFYNNGQLHVRSFWVNGEMHRPITHGPATQEFDIHGKILCQEFYLHGKQVFP